MQGQARRRCRSLAGAGASVVELTSSFCMFPAVPVSYKNTRWALKVTRGLKRIKAATPGELLPAPALRGQIASGALEGPVCRVEPFGALGFLRWAECDSILRDFKTFSAAFALSTCSRSGGRDENRHASSGRPTEAHASADPHAAGLHASPRGCDGAPHAGHHPEADRRRHGRRQRVRFPASVRPSPPR